MTKELSREQIEDLRNEICAENGWIAAEIPRFHALCDMALRSSPEGLEIVVSPEDNTIWLCADSGDRKGMVNLRIVCRSESIANSAFNRVCDKAVSALAPADGNAERTRSGVFLCNKHGGYGFTSDCEVCKSAVSDTERKER